jgi:L-iditol 2-dehydrogenase
MLENRMKAAVLYGVKDLRVEDLDIPSINPGELLVRVRAATTCGTDVKIYQRGYVSGVIKPPTIFGHEWAGDVVEVGEGVSWVKKGMRIRAGNSGPCLQCRMCQVSHFNLCEEMTWLWGAYAEFIKVPPPITRINVQELPPQLTYEEAAVTEPLACCLHGIKKCNIEPGDTVVIIGEGPIGLLHLQLARLMGGRTLIVCGLIEERLKKAEKLGADITINASIEQTIREIKVLTDGYGADVVIEAVGLPATWEEALRVVRKGGTVLEFGGCPPGTEIQVSTEQLHYDETTLIGAFHATPSDFRRALTLITSGLIQVKPIITKQMPLEQIHDAFNLLTTSKKELKIAILS